MLEMNLMHWTYAGRETSRLGSRALGPWFIADCLDGKIFAVHGRGGAVAASRRAHGQPRVGRRGDLRGPTASRAEPGCPASCSWTTGSARGRWTSSTAQRRPTGSRSRRSTACARCTRTSTSGTASSSSTSTSPASGTSGCRARPSRYSTIQWSLRRPAPRIGMHTEEVDAGPVGTSPASAPCAVARAQPPRRPLEDVRVLDFTQVWAGPFCTQNLAHLGAEVIRVETMARTPCITRMIPPFADDEPGPGRAGFFNQYNQGKRSIFLNLRKPRSRPTGLRPGQAMRRRHGQLLRRRDGQTRPRLRHVARDQTRHHPDLHVGLRADGTVPLLPRLRTPGVGAVRTVLAHGLSGR